LIDETPLHLETRYMSRTTGGTFHSGIGAVCAVPIECPLTDMI
jgi:hypothetical protein